MKGKKILIVSLIINIVLIGVICNFIKKDYLNNERIIVKTMTETENESQIETLNQSHQSYKEYIDASKKQLATAITNKGVATTSDSTLETMTANVNKIVTNPPASLISYDNTSSGLTSNNVQGAVDELNDNLNNIISGNSGEVYYYKVGKVVTIIMDLKQRTIEQGFFATIPFKPIRTIVISDLNGHAFSFGYLDGKIYTEAINNEWCELYATYITND